MGWVLIGLSAMLVVLFQPLWELSAPLWFVVPVRTSSSEEIDVTDIWFREGRYGRYAVFRLAYEFRADDGIRYRGVSYVSEGDDRNRTVRSVVEYWPGVPWMSRLRGHRLTPGGPWSLLVLAPGLVGVALNQSISRARRTSP